MVNLTRDQCETLISLVSEERNALQSQLQDDPDSVSSEELEELDELACVLRMASDEKREESEK